MDKSAVDAAMLEADLHTPIKLLKQRTNSIELLMSPYQSDAEDGYQSVEFDELLGEELSDDGLDDDAMMDAPNKNKRKSRKFMDKLAESVKSSTAKTGKQVVRGSVKVGKGTVSAGKAIIAPMRNSTAVRSKKPPLKEPPKRGAKAANRQTKRELLAVNRTMKRIERRKKNKNWLTEPNLLAGQLSPPEQSLRSTSNALSRMMSNASSSKEFQVIANEQFVDPSELDTFFLQGGASQLGVVPPENFKHASSLVARCMWESHWREEWCGIYETCLLLFAPLTSQTPTLQLWYSDITAIRPMETNEFSPLPGYPILVIETGWQCYYLAFANDEARDAFSTCLEEQQRNKEQDVALRKARFWQGFQGSVAAMHESGNHKWAKVPSGSHSHHRSILNGRRMVFDVAAPDYEDDVEMEQVVGKVLELALSTSFDTLETNPAQVVEFLNMTSQLRSLPLHRMDLSEPSSFCIFVNLYHCLLQHALLLTVHGPLHKKSNSHFMRSNCYEIGGDVFSLAELYHCVIRGTMSKPVSPKPPYMELPSKKTCMSFTSLYALVYTDPRLNFVLHTGDVSCPPVVPILRQHTLEQQLHTAATEFIQNHVTIDRNVVVLPKICDVYRNDFGGVDAALHFCLSLSEDEAAAMPDCVIRFEAFAEQYHQLLGQKRAAEEEKEVDDDHADGVCEEAAIETQA